MTRMTVRVRGAERGEREQRDDDKRQRQDRLDDAAQGIVDEALEIADDEAERRARDGAEQRRERRNRENVAGADDHPREDVAAELVGAEPMLDGTAAERSSEDRIA